LSFILKNIIFRVNQKSPITKRHILKSLNDDLLFGALLVHHGIAEGLVAGSLSTSAQVIRGAIRGIGLAPNIRSLSSMFLMKFPSSNPLPSTLAFADCAVLQDPDAHQTR